MFSFPAITFITKLLFNNFNQFKNFIVNNFTKQKFLELCQEFINQIYPVDTSETMDFGAPIVAPAPTIVQPAEKADISNDTTSQDNNSTDDSTTDTSSSDDSSSSDDATTSDTTSDSNDNSNDSDSDNS